MNRFFVFLFSFLFPVSVLLAGPQKKIDSLLHALAGQKDTARVLTLIKLSQAYISVNKDSGFFYGMMLKREAEAWGNQKHISDAYVILGTCFYHLDKEDSAMFYKRKAIAVAQKANYPKGVANALNDIGLYKNDDGEIDSAVYFLIQATEIREKANDEKPLGASYLNLGFMYYSQKDFPNAMLYYKKAEKLFLKFGEMKNYSRDLNLIGAVYDEYKKYDSALVIYQRALSIRDSINDQQGISETEINIAVAYRNLSELSKSEDFLLKSLAIKKQLKDVGGEADCLLDLSETYRLEKKYPLAESGLQRADSLGKIGGTKELQRDVYGEFATLYAELQKFDKAFYYRGKFQEMKDSIFNEEKVKVLTDIQTKYETGKKERENIQLKEKEAVDALAIEKEQNRQLVLYAGIGILVVVLSLSFYAYRTKMKSNELLTEKNAQVSRHNKTLKELNAKLIESEEELTMLNETKDKLFSVISHDISNPVKAIANYNQAILSRINELTKEELAEALKKVNQSVQPLQGFIDNLLHWSLLQRKGATISPEKFSATELAEEIKLLYAPYASQKKIDLQNSISADIFLFTDKNMFRLVLRNLLSNAIKYSKESGVVKITTRNVNGNIQFSISDEGSGIEKSKISTILSGKKVVSERGTFSETGTGLGLSLVVEYLRLNKSDLKIESEVGRGSVFSFELPSA
jgi:signal transduction histidine kinase